MAPKYGLFCTSSLELGEIILALIESIASGYHAKSSDAVTNEQPGSPKFLQRVFRPRGINPRSHSLTEQLHGFPMFQESLVVAAEVIYCSLNHLCLCRSAQFEWWPWFFKCQAVNYDAQQGCANFWTGEAWSRLRKDAPYFEEEPNLEGPIYL